MRHVASPGKCECTNEAGSTHSKKRTAPRVEGGRIRSRLLRLFASLAAQVHLSRLVSAGIHGHVNGHMHEHIVARPLTDDTEVVDHGVHGGKAVCCVELTDK